ncbi:hypothetical protein [Streptosporangium sp. NPDC049078]|uniref:hypothetical protein n=1 Tax=Streptosporangium sp. NPDC049078 TaxID=3155767 RepID=UPI00342B04DD
MHGDPITTSKPVEAKVKAMTVGIYLASAALLLVLEMVKGDLSLIDFLPGWVQALVAPLLPTAIAAVAGYKARHEPRPDLPMSQR